MKDSSKLRGERPQALSPRERQVLALLATGAKKDEIARQLGVSPYTVANQTRSIREKTDTRSVFELVYKTATGRIVIDEPDKAD